MRPDASAHAEPSVSQRSTEACMGKSAFQRISSRRSTALPDVAVQGAAMVAIVSVTMTFVLRNAVGAIAIPVPVPLAFECPHIRMASMNNDDL